MGLLSLVGRANDRIRRREDLSPIAERVRARLWEGNARMLLAGKNPDGTDTAPLRPSTLARRKGDGPPRVPRGRNSRAIKGCVVTAAVAAGQLRFLKSWPSFTPVVDYLSLGTRRMAARPVHGFRREDLDYVRDERRRHNLGGGR